MKLRNLFAAIALIAVIGFSMTGCDDGDGNGGSKGDKDLGGNITITPSTGVTIGTKLTANYTGKENISYQWKRGDTNVGTNSNEYIPDQTGSYTVTVGATGYKSKISAAVNVSGGANAPTVANVTVNPATVSVAKGKTQQFIAIVTGTNNPAQTVNWTVTGGGNGTNISASGYLTIAANETAATLTVKAVSTVDTSKSGTAAVTVTAPILLTVSDAASWGDAVNGIRTGGNDKVYIITVTGDISIPVSTDSTFGSVTGVTVNIEGNGTFSMPSGNGRLLQIGDKQTVVVKNLTLQGRDGNTNEVVRVNTGGTFRMEGSSSVTGNTSSGSGGGVYVSLYGTFIMQDNASVRGNTVNSSSNAYGGGVNVNNGTFIMQGNASVSNNSANSSGTNAYAYGGGVCINGETFIMRDNASVSDNTVSVSFSANYAYGGGVCIRNGNFTLEGGAISDNAATGGNYGNAQGGGVYVDITTTGSNGTFTMRNGTISGNTVEGKQIAWGGAVFGVLIMEDGEITGNTVTAISTSSTSVVEARGGGVNANLTMRGGTISGNTVNAGRTYGSTMVYGSGGGVYGTVTMQGGSISGNTVNVSNSNSSSNVTIYGGGVCVMGNINKTGGTIYGNDAAEGLKNIADGGKGHAVYSLNENWRNATAGPTINSDTYGFWSND